MLVNCSLFDYSQCTNLALVILFLLFSLATSLSTSLPQPQPHPRLLLNNNDLNTLIKKLQHNSSSQLNSIYKSIQYNANLSLTLPLTPYSNCTVVGACRNAAIFGANAVYLDVSMADTIIMNCAFYHRLLNTSESTIYSSRAITELLHISTNWTSWYWPVGQALERGGLAFTVGVAYDWLYPFLSPSERIIIEDAMGEKVLLTRLQDERQGMWWIKDIYNWNINSNSGLLAITQSLQDVDRWAINASSVEQIVLNNLPTSVESFEPQGVWPEGQTYGMYAAVSLLQGCEAYRTGTLGLNKTTPLACSYPKGICSAGLTWLLMTGPRGESFNYADASAESPDSRALFVLGRMCNITSYNSAARSFSRTINTWIDLIWYQEDGSISELYKLPLANIYADLNKDTAYGNKTHLGSFRSAWSWPSEDTLIPANTSASIWLAFKGGQNSFNDHQGGNSHNNHGHLDVGNFVYEAQGYRFAIDMGADAYDYPLLSYFGRFRFGYNLVSSYGHNVLSFDGDSQHRQGSGGIIESDLTIPNHPRAIVDLTSAYQGSVSSYTRSFELLGQDTSIDRACVPARIIDHWIGGMVQVQWYMYTTANVDLSSGSPILTAPSTSSSSSSSSPSPRLQLLGESSSGYTITWSVELLQNLPPQKTTYGNEFVWIIKGSVAASAGLINITFLPCV